MDKLERHTRTKRIIGKRLRIMKMWALIALRGPESKEKQMEAYRGIRTPHLYHKFNLNCGCHVCRSAKQYVKYKRTKMKRETERAIREQLSERGFIFK